MKDIFDKYVWLARVAPAVLALFPLLFGVIAVFPELLGVEFPSLLGFAGFVGIAWLAQFYVRARGKSVQEVLLLTWGGWPTRLQLQLSTSTLPAARLSEIRSRCSSLVEKSLPTLSDEEGKPQDAADRYDVIVDEVKERLRNDVRLQHENTQYGFVRNSVGVRYEGRALAGIGLVISSFCTVYGEGAIPWVSTLLCAILFGYWVFIVRDSWARNAAFSYAERFCTAVLGLHPKTKTED